MKGSKGKTAGAAAVKSTQEIQFILERETKGALRFQEVDANDKPLESPDDGAIGTLYVRKAFIAGLDLPDTPQSCTVTIRFHE
jgi:hypothetical protein